MSTTNSAVKHLFCPKCQAQYDITTVINLCRCGSPLLVDYDLDAASRSLTRESLTTRRSDMWKYREVLPVLDTDNIVTLGEGGTPLLASRVLGQQLGYERVYFKDESGNPTGSFKARGLSMAVSKAKELSIKRLIIPTAGNAGSALAAYAARAGMEVCVLMPKDSPSPFLIDCRTHGARVILIDGTIKDCGEKTAQMVADEGWFSVATLKEPYRIEGKKTMGYELAEQFDFDLPDVIIYPTGGGTGLIGMWKAFGEMEKLGWLSGKKPKMVSVQSEGCAPIVRAFEQGTAQAELWADPHTCAAGLKVPSAIGDFLILDAVRQSGGAAVAVSESDIIRYSNELASKEGIFPAPEGGAAVAALKKLKAEGKIHSDDRVVVFITGSGYKYLNVFEEA